MGWYFRKSVGVGPFRMNFSKSGVSYSFGAKGARINTGPRGTFVSFGSNGIYYRKKISGNNHSHSNENYEGRPFKEPPSNYFSTQHHTITSGPIEGLTDTDSQDFVNELNTKAQRNPNLFWVSISLGVILLILFAYFSGQEARKAQNTSHIVRVVPNYIDMNIRNSPSEKGRVIGQAYPNEVLGFIDSANGWTKVRYGHADSGYAYISDLLINHDSLVVTTGTVKNYQEYPIRYSAIFFVGLISLILLCVYVHKNDLKRLSMEINYEMDDKIKEVYGKFLKYFADGVSANKIWQIIHSQGTHDWKRNAGASSLVNRVNLMGISLNKMPAPHFKTNIQIPSICLKGTELYFFPERLVIKKNNQFAAVFYKNLNIEQYSSRFIEDETLPTDAQVVGETWKYVNKNGTPDRRFNDNRLLPICQYSYYTFTSGTGVYETLCTSKQGSFDNFSSFVKAIGEFQKKMHLN